MELGCIEIDRVKFSYYPISIRLPKFFIRIESNKKEKKKEKKKERDGEKEKQ